LAYESFKCATFPFPFGFDAKLHPAALAARFMTQTTPTH